MPVLPAWLLSKTAGIVVASLIAVGYIIYLGNAIYNAGSTSAKLEQVQAQQQHDKKVHKAYAKIDKSTPYGADTADALEWLSEHTRSSK